MSDDRLLCCGCVTDNSTPLQDKAMWVDHIFLHVGESQRNRELLWLWLSTFTFSRRFFMHSAYHISSGHPSVASQEEKS